MKQPMSLSFFIKIGFVILIILWLTGIIHLPLLNTPLIHIFGRAFTVQHLLMLLFFGYVIRFLPGMVQTIVAIFLVIWLLSIFIFPALGGLWSILLLILLVWILFSFI